MVEPIVAQYVSDGWVFVAARLNRPSTEEMRAAVHPLVFSFATSRAVYPLKLTGVGATESCGIDLYVFGTQRAEAPSFEVVRSDSLDLPELGLNEDHGTGEIGNGPLRFLHPELRRLIQNASVGTKLSAQLTPIAMTEDTYIQWVPFEPHRPAYYTTAAANGEAHNVVMIPLAVLAVLIFGAAGLRSIRKSTAVCLVVVVLIRCVFAGVMTRGSLETVEVDWRSTFTIARQSALMDALVGLEEAAESDDAPAVLTAEWARGVIARWIERETRTFRESYGTDDPFLVNAFTGKPIKHEDSPGNYTVRDTDQGLEYACYDFVGSPYFVYVSKPGAEEAPTD